MTEQQPADAAGQLSPDPVSTGRSGWWRIAVAVAVVVLLVVLVERGIRLQSDSVADDPSTSQPAAEPTATRLDDGISFGAQGPVVEIYLDYLCEPCADLEARVGTTIAEMVRAEEMTLVLRPVKFSPFSGRAAAAMSCSVDSGHALAYQRAVFANAQGTLSAERLEEIATAVGIDDAGFEECLTARGTRSFVNAMTKEARDRGVAGVPALYVDGEQVDPAITETPEDFRPAIDELSG